MKVYANGEMVDRQSLKEIFEPGFLFGWGVFEPLRAYQGKIPFLDDHLSRLHNSCRLVGLTVPKIDWPNEVDLVLKENKLSNAYLRITVYKKRKNEGALIYADDFKYYASDAYENGFSAVESSLKRDENDISCRVKTISYLNNRMAWAQAQEKGKDEALMVNLQGNLAGGSRSNLFILKGNTAITPALSQGAFCGITRLKVIKILQDLNYKVQETKITAKDLLKADEAFLTSALLEVMPLVACNADLIGKGAPGETAVLARKEYQKLL